MKRKTNANAYSYDGKPYAYPMCLEMLGIYYNVDLFEEAGITEIPKTFEQMEEACSKLQEKNITPKKTPAPILWTRIPPPDSMHLPQANRP